MIRHKFPDYPRRGCAGIFAVIAVMAGILAALV